MVGDISAKVYIIEFSEYECPYCKTMEPVIGKIIREYHGSVALVRFNLPLPSHEHSMGAAMAAECASRLERYGEYHSFLFEHPEYVESANWLKLAVIAGVSDTAGFRSCINDSDAKGSIEREVDFARELGVRGAPTFVVNGHVQMGAVDERRMKMIIERSLREMR